VPSGLVTLTLVGWLRTILTEEPSAILNSWPVSWDFLALVASGAGFPHLMRAVGVTPSVTAQGALGLHLVAGVALLPCPAPATPAHRLWALPPVDQHLLRFEAWTQRRLAALAAHPHERLLRRFALWQQLPRLRADAAVRPLRATAATYAINQFNAATVFLNWLNTNEISPAAAKQADLDAWAIASGVGHRQWVQGFLSWATSTRAMPRLVLIRPRFNVGNGVTQQQRLSLLRCYLTTDALPPRERAVACLILLFGQPISRIHRLHRDDLHQAGDTLSIRFGDPPTPVPEPLAALIRDLASLAPPPGWLFPGRNAGQPITHRTLHCNLRKLGVPISQARVSALRQLATQVPAPVIADALGIHQTTATRQAINAGTTWSLYAAARPVS
jgi:hypothetical protein